MIPAFSFTNTTTGKSTGGLSGATLSGLGFTQGDAFEVDITNAAPNAAVIASANHNGTMSTSQIGITNSAGNFTVKGVMDASTLGLWAETWSVAAGGNASALTITLGFIVAPSTANAPISPVGADCPVGYYYVPAAAGAPAMCLVGSPGEVTSNGAPANDSTAGPTQSGGTQSGGTQSGGGNQAGSGEGTGTGNTPLSTTFNCFNPLGKLLGGEGTGFDTCISTSIPIGILEALIGAGLLLWAFSSKGGRR